MKTEYIKRRLSGWKERERGKESRELTDIMLRNKLIYGFVAKKHKKLKF
jgi:hypothetical protein